MPRRLLALLALLLVLVACSAPQMVSLSAAGTTDNDGKQLVVDGFVSPGVAITCGGDNTCGLDLIEAAGQQSGNKMGMFVAVGDGANSMDSPPSDYTPDSLRIRAADGSLVKAADKVRVSGKVSVAPGTCFVTADKIEKV